MDDVSFTIDNQTKQKMTTLYIFTSDSELRELLTEQIARTRPTDSGFDIPMLEIRKSVGPVVSFPLGIRVAATETNEPRPCLLLPRSSICHTPFRLCNSIGLIDMGYRGEVKAVCDNIDRIEAVNIDKGARYFQLCTGNFLPWKEIVIVDKFDDLPVAPDNRGSGGFGSTG